MPRQRPTGRAARRHPESTASPSADENACPCGLGEPYAACCGPLHRSVSAAVTAQDLMRSRYSAFAVGDEAYLLRTWHPDTRPARLELDPAQRWVGLEVLGTTAGSAFHSEGTVEFRAHYSRRGQRHTMHEDSAFARIDGAWVYIAPVGPQA